MGIRFDLRDTTLSTAQLVGLAIGRETQDSKVIAEHLRRAGYSPDGKRWREGVEAASSVQGRKS